MTTSTESTSSGAPRSQPPIEDNLSTEALKELCDSTTERVIEFIKRYQIAHSESIPCAESFQLEFRLVKRIHDQNAFPFFAYQLRSAVRSLFLENNPLQKENATLSGFHPIAARLAAFHEAETALKKFQSHIGEWDSLWEVYERSRHGELDLGAGDFATCLTQMYQLLLGVLLKDSLLSNMYEEQWTPFQGYSDRLAVFVICAIRSGIPTDIRPEEVPLFNDLPIEPGEDGQEPTRMPSEKIKQLKKEFDLIMHLKDALEEAQETDLRFDVTSQIELQIERCLEKLPPSFQNELFRTLYEGCGSSPGKDPLVWGKAHAMDSTGVLAIAFEKALEELYKKTHFLCHLSRARYGF